MIKRQFFAAMVAWTVGQPFPALAQSSTKELLNRAQSEADKRAVEELVEKLKSRNPSQATPAGPPTPAPPPNRTEQSGTPSSEPPQQPSASMPKDTPPPRSAQSPETDAPRASTPPSQPPEVTQETPPSPQPALPPVATVPAPKPESAAPAPSEAASVAQPTPSASAVLQAAEKLDLPRVDIEVFFALDSAEISPASIERLAQLGQALTDPRLRGSKFVIAGHTDAFGPASYNLTLSQRRAEAVRHFLIERFRMEPDALIARGFGSQAPKVRRNPFAPENRRVQIINWTAPALSEQR